MAIINNMNRRRFALRTASPAIVAVVALLMAWATPAMAGGIWTSKACVPTVGVVPPCPPPGIIGVEGMSVGVEDRFIVAAYGYDNSFGDTNTTRVYDVVSNTWAIKAPAPLPVRSEGIGVLRDGWLYSIGGRDSTAGVVLNDFDRYKLKGPGADTWLSLPPMPTARAGLGGAVSGRYMYAIGGRTGTGGPCSPGFPVDTVFDTVERFDTLPTPYTAASWSTMAPLPAGRERSDLAALAMGNGKIYVFGGCDASHAVVGYVDVYDINSNSWSLTPPPDMPTPRAAFYQVGFAGPNIYVMGGADTSLVVSCKNEVFNTSTNTWSSDDTPMLTCRGEMGVGSVGGTIWTVGGARPAFGTSSNALETFRP